MIPMLRRRLMSNMAKAKNIATGNVNASSDTVTINNVGFKANHLVMFVINGLEAYQSFELYETSAGVYVHCVVDGNWNTRDYPATVNFKDNSITVTLGGDSFSSMNGTYRYIAWQE